MATEEISAAEGPELTARIAAFLRQIGLDVVEAPLAEHDGFLPGIRIDHGRLLYDPARLRWPGDLLHEAGHLAVAPAAIRARMSDALEGVEVAHGGEVEAMAWSYAAIRALDLDPSVLFHAGGYHGQSPSLIQTYALGVYPGCHGLALAGLTLIGEAARAGGVPPYPHMVRWLRGDA